MSDVQFDDDFKEIGKTALMGCGATPGMSNIFIRYVCNQLDEVEKIYLRLGFTILGEPQEVVSAWDPGWSPEIAETQVHMTVFEGKAVQRDSSV